MLQASGTPPFKNDNADSVNSSQKMRDDTNSGFVGDESVGIANRCLKPGKTFCNNRGRFRGLVFEIYGSRIDQEGIHVFLQNMPYYYFKLCNEGILLCTGLPNVDGTSDEVLHLERQSEKRGRLRNSSKSPVEKYQAESYGKENVKLDKLTTDTGQKDKIWIPNGSLDQSAGDGGLKTLRQLQAEEDEEESFQADLKQAVMQSLACQKMPLVSNSTNGHKRSQDFESFGTKANGVTCENVNSNLVGLGLQNEVGEYNCYLNVIIQSLWHLRQFREEFLMRSASEHVHVGDPCVVCALFDILTALSRASLDASREAVSPSNFQIALSNLYPESNFFQEGQMNDASEVLGVIFECLHQSFTSDPGDSDSDSAENNGKGSWDCSSHSCIVHTLFGMDVFERMNCFNCRLEPRHLKYTSFFHNINATALRTLKVLCPGHSFDELLNLMETNHQLACDPEARGCGKPNHIHHILSKPPNVFTTVIGWQNTFENIDDIKATLAALSTEIDISIFYRSLDPQNPYRLAVVVCYYGQHYHCFAYSYVHEKWIML